MEKVYIEKLVHGGQGLGVMPDGKKVFVWNALPGETVNIRVIKKKRSYLEAIAEEIVVASKDREQPSEPNYLATSPWQMMRFEAENKHKRSIVESLFFHEKVALPDLGAVIHNDQAWNYRNKMEYSFWGDEDGLHLALHCRGSHGKEIVTGSKLALPALDAAANSVLEQLRNRGTRAGDLKTIIVRSSQDGSSVASLFVKTEQFDPIEICEHVQGIRVYHSNPKSPASVPSRLLHELGDVRLHDSLLGMPFTYDVDSFFQVNIPVFEQALRAIQSYCNDVALVDMYAGVGSIGLSVAKKRVDLIELDPHTAAMARINAHASGLNAEVTKASTEKVLNYITAEKPVIFDPPRAGLHDHVTTRVLEILPPKLIYLSCNPATHARDIARLKEAYEIVDFRIFNFFPRTPHIETLAVLIRKD